MAASRAGVDSNDTEALGRVAETLDVSFVIAGGVIKTLLSGDDVTQTIRTEEVGAMASVVAAHPNVRQALLCRQQEFATGSGLIADGRDMGTVVFPEAQHKFFLTASAEERAKRRVKQLHEAGNNADYDKIFADIQVRDERDSSRATAPLKPADDAILIDCTSLSIDEVLACIMREIKAVLK